MGAQPRWSLKAASHMSDLETIQDLLDAIAKIEDALAPPERDLYVELRLRCTESAMVRVGDARSLEVILRNVGIRNKLGLKIQPDRGGF